jgi:hypothetical protein
MATLFSRNQATAAALLAVGVGLGACANGSGGGGGLGNVGYGGLGSPGVGTAAGALGGAALGRVFAGQHNNTAAILGGAALGGLAGNVLGDKPSEQRRAQEQQQASAAAADAEQQRRLDYDKQSQLQQAQTQKQIEDQRLFEEWKAQRQANLAGQANAETASTTATSPGDVMQGQRLLTALGYYKGPIDGKDGPATQSAVRQFQTAQGLPITGEVTPSLINKMRTVL